MAEKQAAGGSARPDGCIPLKGTVGLLAQRLGGELLRNKDGVYVLRGMGAGEAIFPDEASAFEHLKRYMRIANMGSEAHLKTNEIVANQKEFPVNNWEGLAKLQNEISEAEPVPVDPSQKAGGEKAPFFVRHNKGIMGRVYGTSLGQTLMRGHAFLMQMGEGGVWSANALKRFETVAEQLELQLTNRIGPALDQLHRWTTVKEMKSKTMPQEALDLWNQSIAPTIESAQRMHDFLDTGEEAAGPDGIPAWYGARVEDIPQDMVTKARKAGHIGPNDGRDELARMFNDPNLGGRRQGESMKDFKSRAAWLKRNANALGGHAAHVRAGEEGYVNDIRATMVAWARAQSRRIAEASIFGPNGERIQQASERIGGDHPFGPTDQQLIYHRTMKELMGKVYVPRTEFERTANNIMRFMLGSSGSRHIAQNKIAIMQHGMHGVAAGLGKELFDPAHIGADIRELRSIGVTMRQASHFLDEHPGDLFLDRAPAELRGLVDKMKKFGTDTTGVLARATTKGLHIILNTDRVLAGLMAKNNFDSYYMKALKGDRNKLGLFADMLGFGNPNTNEGRIKMMQDLQGMDRRQVRSYFVKRMADTVGTTFHPGDLPNLARVREPFTGFQIGKWLAMFRSFRWNVAHNIWNQMTSPNYSKAYRARVFGRFLMSTPLSAVDPILRHVKLSGAIGLASAIGVGVANVDSRLAYDSFEKALKDPHTSDMLYALTMLSVNDGTLGIGADMVQGWNLSNAQIYSRAAISGNIPIIDTISAASIATSLAAHGGLTHDKKAMIAAHRELLADAPFGNAIAYATGERKQPRVPKHQVIREVLQKGAKAVGLE